MGVKCKKYFVINLKYKWSTKQEIDRALRLQSDLITIFHKICGLLNKEISYEKSKFRVKYLLIAIDTFSFKCILTAWDIALSSTDRIYKLLESSTT